MTDIISQSTSSLPGDTNKYISKEIYRGSTSITPIAQSTGYKLSADIDLGQFNSSRIIPDIEVYIDDSGGGTTQYSKCPLAEVDTSGNVLRSVNVAPFNNVAKGGGYTLGIEITYFHRTSNSAKTFYYRVMSAEAGPYVSGSWTG